MPFTNFLYSNGIIKFFMSFRVFVESILFLGELYYNFVITENEMFNLC